MSKKILFIEDQHSFQDAMSKFFKEKGFSTLSAYDGEAGVRLAESDSPDIIFLDIVVPKKDGFEVLNELRKNPNTTNIPVVVLTNLEGAMDVDKALSLGAEAYLVKTNYSFEDLLKKANEILGKHDHK